MGALITNRDYDPTSVRAKWLWKSQHQPTITSTERMKKMGDFIFSHAECPKCDKPAPKQDKCPTCKGWVTFVYIPKESK